MAWIEAYGLAGVDVSTPGVADYTRGAIAQWGVGQGLSGNQILNLFQDNGVGIRRSLGQDLIATERQRQAASLSSTALNVDYSTSSIVNATPPANWTGQFVHQVTMTYRDTVAPGAYELHTRTIGIKAGTPLTPFSAVEAAMNVITPQAGETGSPDMPLPAQVIMSQLTGTYYDTQGRNLPTALGQAV
jgi:hypothetical protein